MAALRDISADMRLDCRGQDYLLTSADQLFNGQNAPPDYFNWSKVLYKEAQLKGKKILGRTMCTWNVGAAEGCAGAWHIDEHYQNAYGCDLPVDGGRDHHQLGGHLRRRSLDAGQRGPGSRLPQERRVALAHRPLSACPHPPEDHATRHAWRSWRYSHEDRSNHDNVRTDAPHPGHELGLLHGQAR